MEDEEREREKEEKNGTARHSCTENKEMNHIQRLAEDMGVCVCVLGGGVVV